MTKPNTQGHGDKHEALREKIAGIVMSKNTDSSIAKAKDLKTRYQCADEILALLPSRESVLDAEKIARHIFEVGDEPESKTQRMQFLGGKYPGSERPQGGLCESALAKVIKNAIEELK